MLLLQLDIYSETQAAHSRQDSQHIRKILILHKSLNRTVMPTITLTLTMGRTMVDLKLELVV